MPGMTASATIFVDEKQNTLLLSGKALRFTPDMAYMKKMFEKMKASGNMPKMPAGAPAGGSMAQNASAGKASQGFPGGGMMPGGMNNDPKAKTVWLKDEKMGLRPAFIKIGIDNGTNVEILSGLNEGDEVVISSGGTETKSAATSNNNNRPRGPFPF